MPPSILKLFVASPPGLEHVVAEEVHELGGHDARVVPGGVELTGSFELVARLNVWSRCANRVLVRVGSFEAAHLSQLRRRSARLDWLGVLDRERPVRVSATCRRSRIYHSGAAAHRVRQGIADALGNEPPEVEHETRLEVMVRIEANRATISVDSSGELLHKRGYRQRTAKAPLRENLAAAFLRLAGWPRHAALLDPMCGSGTFLIEAALIARGVAPGSRRTFACQSWPGMQPEWFDAETGPRTELIIYGADRDAGAVEATQENAARAGVDIEVACHALSHNEPRAESGLIITNPPYGGRVSSGKDLRNLYAALGNLKARRFAAWRLAVVTRSARLAAQTGLPLEPLTGSVEHGGARVGLYALG